MAIKNDQGRSTVKKYKYFDQLEFLGIIFEDRESINISPLDIKNEFDMDNHTEESENFDNASQADTRVSETDDEERFTQVQSFTEHKRGPKRRHEESGSEISKVMKYMVEKMETSSSSTEKHPVDVFLSGIAPTLKSLSPYYLSLAKTQIYSIVQEYEMAMIMHQKSEQNKSNLNKIE